MGGGVQLVVDQSDGARGVQLTSWTGQLEHCDRHWTGQLNAHLDWTGQLIVYISVRLTGPVFKNWTVNQITWTSQPNMTATRHRRRFYILPFQKGLNFFFDAFWDSCTL